MFCKSYDLSLAPPFVLGVRKPVFGGKGKDFFPTDQISAPENVSRPLK